MYVLIERGVPHELMIPPAGFKSARLTNAELELPFAQSHVTDVRKGRSQYTGPAEDQRPQVKATAS